MNKIKVIFICLLMTAQVTQAIETRTAGGIVLVLSQPETRAFQGCPDLLGVQTHITTQAEIYSMSAVKQAQVRQQDRIVGQNDVAESLNAFYKRMIEKGGMRELVGAPDSSHIDELAKIAPNFSEVVGDIKLVAGLQRMANEPIKIDPILVVGSPGTGKTHFAATLAKIIGSDFVYVPMASLTASWILAGAAAQWKGAHEGKVADAIVNGRFANPVIMLDEIDKASSSDQYDPVGPLYALLESDTARTFKDEYIDVQIDASHIIWIATANDVTKIPEPILKRMTVYPIRDLTLEESRVVAKSIYAKYLEEHPLYPLDKELSEGALDRLSTMMPRAMTKEIKLAAGRAYIAGRKVIEAADVQRERQLSAHKQPIGFVQPR